MRWREFVASERDLFERAGLPGVLVERQPFVYFLEHGYVDDGSDFVVDGLNPDQRQALRQLVLLYVERFEAGARPDLYLSSLGLA
jgi:hypothetical protein